MSRYKGKLDEASLGLIASSRAEWMTTALATHQPDRARAEKAARALYRAHDLPEPPVMIWMDSPLGCIYAAETIRQLGDQLGDQLGRQL
ncbi:MAG TPA: hypothetical protein VM782_18125, partial [Stellaceae bacterium]|nr:hypothetical protein [Stellaceae bacterium]